MHLKTKRGVDLKLGPLGPGQAWSSWPGQSESGEAFAAVVNCQSSGHAGKLCERETGKERKRGKRERERKGSQNGQPPNPSREACCGCMLHHEFGLISPSTLNWHFLKGSRLSDGD